MAIEQFQTEGCIVRSAISSRSQGCRMTQLFHFQDIEIIRIARCACGAKCSKVVKEIAGTRSGARLCGEWVKFARSFPAPRCSPSHPIVVPPRRCPPSSQEEKKRNRAQTANPGNCNAVQLLVARRWELRVNLIGHVFLTERYPSATYGIAIKSRYEIYSTENDTGIYSPRAHHLECKICKECSSTPEWCVARDRKNPWR